MQADKKTTVLVWASVGAAAAGIAVAAVLFKCRGKICSDEAQDEVDHRHLEQVLRDCYNKIQEIEARLPEIGNAPAASKPTRSTAPQRIRSANGKPA